MAYESIIKEIADLKKDRRAVILAHNYQVEEVQKVADFVGDSLELSRRAARTEAEVIVFCGVNFMAETAALLSPDKLVLLPEMRAGCPMADMITAASLGKLKREHPEAVVVAYVNTSAAVKAETDICCTSANAVAVINSIPPEREIIFVPDKYLAAYVSRRTGRRFITWPGYCPTHVKILAEDIARQKRLHPRALVMVHPECPPGAIDQADEVLSTSGMIESARRSAAQEIIVGTETGLIARLRRENPGKRFFPASEAAVCPNMKRITLGKVCWSLRELEYKITIPLEISLRARRAVETMIDPGRLFLINN